MRMQLLTVNGIVPGHAVDLRCLNTTLKAYQHMARTHASLLASKTNVTHLPPPDSPDMIFAVDLSGRIRVYMYMYTLSL